MSKDTNILKILGLSFSLAKVNFKLRNEGSYLGIFWYILNPLALFAIILFIKNETLNILSGYSYPVYLLIGLLAFNLLTQTLSGMISIISSYGNLLKSVKINSRSLVVARAIQSLFSHIFEIILLCIVAIYFGSSIDGIFLYIIGIAIFMLFILGLSFLFATLGLYVRDLGNVWTAVSHILFFATPIFYIPKEAGIIAEVNTYNPLYYFITFLRSLFIDNRLPSTNVTSIVITLTFAALFVGVFTFNRYQHKFPELV